MEDTEGIKAACDLFNEAYNEKNEKKCLQIINHMAEYAVYINFHPLLNS